MEILASQLIIIVLVSIPSDGLNTWTFAFSSVEDSGSSSIIKVGPYSKSLRLGNIEDFENNTI